MSATREVEREGAEERRRSTPLSLKLGLAASALVVLALLAASIAWPSLKQRYVHPPYLVGGLKVNRFFPFLSVSFLAWIGAPCLRIDYR